MKNDHVSAHCSLLAFIFPTLQLSPLFVDVLFEMESCLNLQFLIFSKLPGSFGLCLLTGTFHRERAHCIQRTRGDYHSVIILPRQWFCCFCLFWPHTQDLEPFQWHLLVCPACWCNFYCFAKAKCENICQCFGERGMFKCPAWQLETLPKRNPLRPVPYLWDFKTLRVFLYLDGE